MRRNRLGSVEAEGGARGGRVDPAVSREPCGPQGAAVNYKTIAYFSMEIGLEPALPTYSGGLGILAGDTLKSAADLGLPVVGITLLHRKGYFQQHLDALGHQT